jgi:hypothetical protein
MKLGILLGLAILAYALTRVLDRIKPAGSQPLKWWQKLAGGVAVILAILIVINPEFLVLGLLGDAAFFDALVLLFSLQLQTVGARVWHCIGPMLSRTMRWVMTPSPGMYYLLTVSAVAIGGIVSTVQKVVHRISS